MANQFQILVPLIGSLLALGGVLATIVHGFRTTSRTLRANAVTAQKTLRANIMTAHRLKWIDQLRDDLPLLLAIGERQYDASLRSPEETDLTIRRELRLVSKRLVVLMGREDDLRIKFAELIREFADAPNEHLADKIEIKGQEVFRQRWNQVRTETGEAPRNKPALSRPTADQPGPNSS